MALDLSHVRLCLVAFWVVAGAGVSAAEESDLERRLRALEEQNRRLTEQVEGQARTIAGLQEQLGGESESGPAPEPETSGWDFGRVHLGGRRSGRIFSHRFRRGLPPWQLSRGRSEALP